MIYCSRCRFLEHCFLDFFAHFFRYVQVRHLSVQILAFLHICSSPTTKKNELELIYINIAIEFSRRNRRLTAVFYWRLIRINNYEMKKNRRNYSVDLNHSWMSRFVWEAVEEPSDFLESLEFTFNSRFFSSIITGRVIIFVNSNYYNNYYFTVWRFFPQHLFF